MKLVFSAAVCGIVALAAGTAEAQPAPPPMVYSQSCAGCHGDDLNGGKAKSVFSQLVLAAHSDDELEHIIAAGDSAHGMPAFSGKLSGDQIAQLVAYLRIHGGMLAPPKPYEAPDGQVVHSLKQTFRVHVVASGLMTPWGMAFLPDGRLLVTERDGRIRIVDHGKLLPDPVKGTPKAWVHQDGGYFDIAVDPHYKKNGWVYLAYSELLPGYSGPIPPDGAVRNSGGAPMPPSMTRVVRAHIRNNEWVDQQDVFNPPARLFTSTIIHYGSRLLFDHKGHLFWTQGERGDMRNAQNLSVPLGKIHRVNVDGSIPRDNPFVNRPGADPTIWTYGHRNPEGLSYDPRTGILWESEHGPTGGDEINIIEKGHDYGWGVVSMGLQPGITHQHEPGMDDPIAYYTPSIAPSGMTFYTGNRYPGWKDNLFVGALVGQKLLRLTIEGRKIVSQEVVFNQFGRTRDVVQGPDGLLYLLVQRPTGRGTGVAVSASTPGAVIRLDPVK